jgi:hypothetical protein
MALMDLIFTWGDSGISHAFISDMVLKVHTEYQRNFENWLDGAVKEPPKLAEIPMHLQHRLQEETATVKQVNEIQRRFSGEGPWARPRLGGGGGAHEDSKKKKKKKKRGRDDFDKAPVKPSAPTPKDGTGDRYMKALWEVTKKDGQIIKDGKKGPCLKFIQTGTCSFGDKCRFSHNKGFWQERGVTWAAVKAAATGGKESESESEDGNQSRSRSRSRSQSRQGGN